MLNKIRYYPFVENILLPWLSNIQGMLQDLRLWIPRKKTIPLRTKKEEERKKEA